MLSILKQSGVEEIVKRCAFITWYRRYHNGLDCSDTIDYHSLDVTKENNKN